VTPVYVAVGGRTAGVIFFVGDRVNPPRQKRFARSVPTEFAWLCSPATPSCAARVAERIGIEEV